MTTKNRLRAQQQARSNAKANHALDKELQSELVNDAYNNKLKNIGPFRATILAIKDKLLVTEKAGQRETEVIDGFNPANFYEVIVRPEWYDNIPAPWTFDDFTFDKNNVLIKGFKAQSAIKNHPRARSVSPMGNGTNGVALKVGDIVVCTFGDGPNNNGRLRDIRFELNKVGEDAELIAAIGGKGAFKAFFKNQKQKGSDFKNIKNSNVELFDAPKGRSNPNPEEDLFKGKQFDKRGYNKDSNDTTGFIYPGKRATYYKNKDRKKEEVNYVVIHSTAGKMSKGPDHNKAKDTIYRFAQFPTTKYRWPDKRDMKRNRDGEMVPKRKANTPCATILEVDGHIDHGIVCRDRGKKLGKVAEKAVYTSVHYCVDQNGNIVQGLEEKHIGYHAGSGKFNRESIGIETNGYPNVGPNKGAGGLYCEMYTETLLTQLAKLTAGICYRWDIPIKKVDKKGKAGLIGHEVISPRNRSDPGEKWNQAGKNFWNWEDFLKRVEKAYEEFQFGGGGGM